MPILQKYTTLVIHGDEGVTNNPRKKYVDWYRSMAGVTVENPETKRYDLAPGEALTVFSGTRTLTLDGTSEFSLDLNTIETSLYRLTNTAGTAVGFRTDRALTLNTRTVTVAVNNNATATFTLSGGSLAAVQVGDTVFLPGPTTGDSTTVFNTLNEGFWLVLAKSGLVLTVRRLVGEDFAGVAEVVTLTSNAQFKAFSSAGVQAGDSLKITSGFSSITQKTFIISTVTADWVEFTSTESLPLETGILPTASGLTVYNNCKRFVELEVDQPAIIRLNGDTGNTNELTPLVSGDSDQMAPFSILGTVFSLVVVNRSSQTMNLNVMSAE